MVDVGGGGVPQAAISQDLVYDLKPYIDENNLQDAVGLNYTMSMIRMDIFMQCMIRLKAVVFGIIQVFLKKQVFLQMHLQIGIHLEMQ